MYDSDSDFASGSASASAGSDSDSDSDCDSDPDSGSAAAASPQSAAAAPSLARAWRASSPPARRASDAADRGAERPRERPATEQIARTGVSERCVQIIRHEIIAGVKTLCFTFLEHEKNHDNDLTVSER